MKEFPGKTDLSGIAEFYDELPLWSAPFGLRLLENIRYRRNITVLDIGYGAGFPLIEIAQRLGSGSVVYGIDPWKDASVRAGKKAEFFGLQNIRFIEGVAESIPLNANSVDLIVSNNGINNVSDMNLVFSECSRILKTGGQFVMTMNLDKTMFEFYTVFEQVLEKHGMIKEIGLMKQHIVHKRPPLDHVLSLLTNHHFLVNTLRNHQFNYQFADGTAMLDHNFIRLAFMDSWLEFLPPDGKMKILSHIEQELNNRASELGSLTLSIPFVVIDLMKKKL